ncbi:MAG TPA: pyridoxal-phosphate dependent enzyme, partial [Candidatus Saccharimonadales bacterium]|nr:pyridoxal-phosphate dependent enzyme [Candidatus Saccharimonadales bacterium]
MTTRTRTETAAEVSLAEFKEAAQAVSSFAYHTPLLTSRLLSERTGFDVRLKAEIFQKGGSFKLRGPLNKFRHLTGEQKQRGVICSSAGNHAQGVALAAAFHKARAVVVMASNATQSKVDATRAYGAEVVQHGMIWDEANEKAKQLTQELGLTYIHPFDDMQLMAGQGTLGMEIYQDFSNVDVVIAGIGGGGLLGGVSMALKALNPKIKVIGVESSGAPGMKNSIAA